MKLYPLSFLLIVLISTGYPDLSGANPDGSPVRRVLDKRYKNIQPPIDDTAPSIFGLRSFESTNANRSETEALIRLQTPIKDQGKRGSCSIFSSTAYLESMLVIHDFANATVDLSEEWLAYLATRTKTDDGSEAFINLEMFLKYGFTYEQTMPYVDEDWRESDSKLEEQRCGRLVGKRKIKCLVNHWDPNLLNASDNELLNRGSLLFAPDFLKARQDAFANRDRYLDSVPVDTTRDETKRYHIDKVSEIKKTLREGQPVLLEFDYYYAAWNDKEGKEHGLIVDEELARKGVVGYPEKDSLDRMVSLSDELGVGHSVLVVGYDDSVVVKTRQKMRDGSVRSFTYKGVYYFKNSWGTEDFGRDFELDGNKYPGYGMIVQKHANELGGFFKLDWK